MLDLEAVDWSSLTHAYGPADDVPAMLKALTEGKASREEAMDDFYGNIWHQGTVYEAATYAVPFLIEALKDKRITDKEGLLLLLANLATGSNDRTAQGELWVRQAHEAVRQGMSVYLSLLESRRPYIRTATAFVLSCFSGAAKEIVPQVRPYLESEKNHDARASLMLCLGTLSDPDPVTHHILEKALQTRRSDPQRLATAISLVRLDRDKAEQKAVRVLQDTLLAPDDFSEAFVFSAWDIDADPGIALYETIRLLGRERAVAAFVELLGKMEGPTDPLVDFLLDTAFEEYRGKSITSQMLTPLQKSALTALIATEAAWDRDQNWEASSVGTREWQYGLPVHRLEVEQSLKEGSE